MTTIGYSSGHLTLAYSFAIPDATNEFAGNLTMQLTCTGINGNVYQQTATLPYLSVYPNEANAPFPGTVSRTFSSVFHYQVTITASN